jgi:hypothetical protein
VQVLFWSAFAAFMVLLVQTLDGAVSELVFFCIASGVLLLVELAVGYSGYKAFFRGYAPRLRFARLGGLLCH